MECTLTALCLRYLTFEYFEAVIEPDRLRDFVLSGCLALQDYAVAKWFHHFQAMLDAGPSLLTQASENENGLEEITDSLDDFAQFYEDGLAEPIAPEARSSCVAFENCAFYENLVLIWSHIYRHQHKSPEERHNASLKLLADALKRNRKLVEEFTSFRDKQALHEFYGGERRYKCPKLTCFHFHEGFKDSKSRDNHIKRHDRPYNCTISDCSAAEFGFSTNKDLEKHTRTYHPEITDLANLFPTVATTPKAKATWPCEICGKKFTRGFILRNHIQSHNGQRPHSCPECGKAFTRANDCKRHQKLHEKR